MIGKFDRSKIAAAGCAAVCLAAVCARAGTVTVDRVITAEVLTREIGSPPPRPEVLYYSFSVDAGSSVLNDSGPDYTGAKSGCIWTNAGRYAGGSMSFDGYNDYVNIGSSLDFPAWDRYSISVWFRHNGGGSSGGYGQKIIDRTSHSQSWFMYMDISNGSVGLKATRTGYTSVGMADTSSNYMDNTWHNIVAVRDGSDGFLWVNGALKAACSNMFAVTYSTSLYLGYSSYYLTAHKKCWSGLLDEIRVFDKALSPSEITDLYAAGCITVPETAVSVSTNLIVCGNLTVTGGVSFTEGIYYSRPLGDLSCGVYTNAP